MKLLENNISQIVALCRKHKVCKLFAFGSILTNRFNDESDVDLLVSFNKSEVTDYFDNYFDFKSLWRICWDGQWIYWRSKQ